MCAFRTISYMVEENLAFERIMKEEVDSFQAHAKLQRDININKGKIKLLKKLFDVRCKHDN